MVELFSWASSSSSSVSCWFNSGSLVRKGSSSSRSCSFSEDISKRIAGSDKPALVRLVVTLWCVCVCVCVCVRERERERERERDDRG